MAEVVFDAFGAVIADSVQVAHGLVESGAQLVGVGLSTAVDVVKTPFGVVKSIAQRVAFKPKPRHVAMTAATVAAVGGIAVAPMATLALAPGAVAMGYVIHKIYNSSMGQGFEEKSGRLFKPRPADMVQATAQRTGVARTAASAEPIQAVENRGRNGRNNTKVQEATSKVATPSVAAAVAKPVAKTESASSAAPVGNAGPGTTAARPVVRTDWVPTAAPVGNAEPGTTAARPVVRTDWVPTAAPVVESRAAGVGPVDPGAVPVRPMESSFAPPEPTVKPEPITPTTRVAEPASPPGATTDAQPTTTPGTTVAAERTGVVHAAGSEKPVQAVENPGQDARKTTEVRADTPARGRGDMKPGVDNGVKAAAPAPQGGRDKVAYQRKDRMDFSAVRAERLKRQLRSKLRTARSLVRVASQTKTGAARAAKRAQNAAPGSTRGARGPLLSGMSKVFKGPTRMKNHQEDVVTQRFLNETMRNDARKALVDASRSRRALNTRHPNVSTRSASRLGGKLARNLRGVAVAKEK